MSGQQQFLKSNTVPAPVVFGSNGLSQKIKQVFLDGGQLVAYSLLFSHISFIPYVHAGPADGVVVGGSGNITQSGLTTTINQTSGSMAIDWGSYNVNSNERVQYNMDSSAISLNNILSHSGSEIHGRIDGAGTIILVNPNGVFFGPTSQVNVGGLIASGLRISPTDFMNGDYIFNEVLGTDGTVVNSGIINASLGGSVALIGKQVKNEGVINARLGAVSMAAGKQAVLTFDNQGLLGVRVSREILQDELGIDPAVLNSGEINAEGGRVLLTASVSRDVFSQAVNTGDIEQASSVVVAADGSFTLGAGADVVNTGVISTSTTEGDAGEVVLLGENVTSSGEIKANSENGNGGEIEIHAADTSLLTDNSLTSARSESNGKGGLVKVLGDKVGLFDQSTVDVSGDTGGGTALIGGDYQGNNSAIRNANRTYVSKQSKLYADALSSGNGGKIINWANDSTWFYGSAFARGGEKFGNGGLIEISAQNLAFDGFADLTAPNGELGTLLFDPVDIQIDDQACQPGATACSNDSELSDDQILTLDGPGPTFYISETALEGLATGANIVLQALNNITVNDLTSDGILGLAINDTDSGSITFTAGNTFQMMDVNDVISTQGGSVTITAGTVIAGNIDTTGDTNQNGGDITITSTSGSISTQSLTTQGGAVDVGSSGHVGNDGGSVTLNASAGTDITVDGVIDTHGTSGIYKNNSGGQQGGAGGAVSLTTSTLGSVVVSSIITDGGNGSGDAQSGSQADPADGGSAGSIDITSNNVTLNGDLSAVGGAGAGSGSAGSDRIANVILNGDNAEAIINYASDFSSVVNIDGIGATNATLTGANRGNSWLITGADSGKLADSDTLLSQVVFTNIDSLSGNADVDNFILTPTGSLSGSIDGKTGTNSLKGRNTTSNTWTVTGGDSGTVNNIMGTFSNIKDLVGGTGADEFRLGDSGSLSGSIDGNTGVNSLKGRNTTNNIWTVTGGDSGTVTNVTNGFSNIADLIGGTGVDNFILANGGSLSGSIDGNTGVNSLKGRDNTDNTWTVTGGDSGTVTNITDGFSNIEDLIGGTGVDNFILANGGSLSGSINGNTGANTLKGRNNTTNTWTVTGADSGTVTNITDGFSNIEDLIGGTGADDFSLGDAGSLSGSINGNTGVNTLKGRNTTTNTWTVTGTNSGTVTNITDGFSNIEDLIGGTGADEFRLGDGGSLTGSIDGNTGANTLKGRNNTTNTWTVTGADSGTVTNITDGFSNIKDLVGGTGTDDFSLGDAGSLSGSIDGNGGTNTLKGRNTTSNTWTVTGADLGTVTNIIGTFSDIEMLIGGTGDDYFTISSSGSLSGSINGNGGSNWLTARDTTKIWDITGVDTGTVNNISDGFVDIQHLVGGSLNNDTFDLTTNNSAITGSINGSGGVNKLIGRDTATTWTITALNAGTTDDVAAFSNIRDIIGGSAGDDFVLNGGSIGAINGGSGGGNSLRANDAVNTWSITSSNAGTVTGTNGFTNIQSITGGALQDTITFAAASSSLSGLIDGGGAANDLLDISALNSGVTVKLGSTVDSNINVDNIETIKANSTQTNEIIAEDKPNTWIIDGIDSGYIANTSSPTPESTVRFNNFKKLTGGINDDVFSFSGVGAISTGGLIDGGDQVDFDSVDYSALMNYTVELGSAFGTVTGAERVIGNSSNTLAAENGVSNTWDISGANSGTVGGIIFTNFGLLQGGDQQDTFDINGGSANIMAGDGNDILNVNLSGTENGSIVFDGEGNDATGDRVNLLGNSAGYEEQFNSNVTLSNHDQFIYNNSGNTFDVTYVNTESIQDDVTVNTLVVNGTTGADTIDLDTEAFTVNSATTVNYDSASKGNLIVDGQASSDIINILSDISISNRVTLNAETINNTTASTITANELLISNAVNAGSNVNRLLTDVNDLYVTNSASVYVQNTKAVNIGQLVNTALLDVISTTGDITDSAVLVSSGELKLKADAGSIMLNDNNQLSGPLSLVASGDVTLNNTMSTDFALVTAQNLTVTSTGQMTDSGVITVSGDTILNSASDIIIDSANDFNNLTVTGATNLLINDINNINVVAIDVNGLADIRANNISLDRINAATVSLDAGSGQITDTNGANTNITASSIVMRANSGIGSGDAIETSTAELDVINNGAGGGLVEIVNTGNVLLTNLVNKGDINFRNDTNVTIDNINADYDLGTLQFDVTSGSVFGKDRGGDDYLSTPDITAFAAFVQVGGEFGTFDRPIVLNLKDELFLASTVSSKVFFGGRPPPKNNDTSDLQISILDSANSVSGQQLIEVESIADIDPAIFTELHNYSKEDISIRMPRDQMFEDDLENLSRL